METGNLSTAYQQTGAVHNSWLKVWGNEVDYVQAHGAFGTELSQAFSLDRTLMSVTTDPNVARRFAGNKGRVFEAYVPKSQFLILKNNGVVKVNASASNRPLIGTTNSYYKTENGEHIFVYDGDGKLIYDVSSMNCFRRKMQRDSLKG